MIVTGEKEKNIFIQQLRGVAILLVLAFHYTNRVPYIFMGSDHPPLIQFYSGSIGVYLFFVISGLLIAKTIEGCNTLGEFYARRLSRIWPLFILANIVVFMWVQSIATPVVDTELKGFDVEGRTIWDLIGTSFFLKDFGFEWIDGVHWSILVELKFYALVGIFAALFNKKFVDAFSWTAITLGIAEFAVLSFWGGGEDTIVNKLLHGLLIAQYLPFFAVGMMLYHRKYNNLTFAICVVLVMAQMLRGSALNPDFTVQETLKFITVFSSFLILDNILAKGKICNFIGEYSYSIYLFHQAIGLSIILALTPWTGIDLAIIFAFAFVLALSVCSSWLVEWRFRRPVTEFLIRMGALIGLDHLRLNLGHQEASSYKDNNLIMENKIPDRHVSS